MEPIESEYDDVQQYADDRQAYDDRKKTDWPFFWRALDQRHSRGRIGNGLLHVIAKTAAVNYSAIRTSILEQEKRDAEERQTQELRYQRIAAEILADPQASEADREWANEILHTQQVA